MRFDQSSGEDKQVTRPDSIVPPIDKTSKAIRTRLLMLFSMLILIIVAMNEAGKPERWEWMGFDQPPTSVKTIELDNNADAPSAKVEFENNTGVGSPLPNRTAPPNNSNLKKSNSTFSVSPTAGQPKSVVVGTYQGDYPTAAVQFWEEMFRKFSPDSQTCFLKLISRIRNGITTPTDQQAETKRIVQLIKQKHDSFEQSLFDELAVATDGTPEKIVLLNQLNESQNIWADKIFPALSESSSGRDTTLSQQNAIIRLQAVIDDLLLLQVQDHTSLGWTGDSGSWIRTWEKVISPTDTDADLSNATSVNRIELMGQPDIYRGKPIAIEGWVRSARKKKLPADTALGIDHYYILWVRPRESKLGPYCVYCQNIPASFPELGNEFIDVNQLVQVDGYFFKIRNYIAADSSVQECPVVIAPKLNIIASAPMPLLDKWQPSPTTLITAFIVIPIGATFIAWFAFQTSRTKRQSPAASTKKRIDDSLDALVKSPEVQTDREKIMALYETNPDD
ncbi:MAG: hypothetical protein GY818_20605 [Planctomycetaceae bacterium]|nr:hypothetical protein [Planctomycetaceae bacterium]